MNEQRLFEPREGKEKKVLARITLNLFRHAEKDGPNDVTQEADQTMRLTEKGRMQAHERGLYLKTGGGVASGSPRQRTGETALHVAHAAEEGITGTETFEELMEKTGHRVWTNSRLDMPFDKNHPDFEELNSHYKADRMLVRYTEMDEKIVVNGGKRGESIYGMQVYNIASLLNRFALITQKMGSINERAEERGEPLERDREHNMGTHGSVAESFLVEIVKRLSGEEEKQKLLRIIPNGVALMEGMQIRFVQEAGKEIAIDIDFEVMRGEEIYQYKKQIPLSVLQEIIEDFKP